MAQKMIEHKLKRFEKLFQCIMFFACCLVKTLQIPLLLAGLLWELEVIRVEKTPVFTRHFKLLVDKIIAKKTVFYAFTQKTL